MFMAISSKEGGAPPVKASFGWNVWLFLPTSAKSIALLQLLHLRLEEKHPDT